MNPLAIIAIILGMLAFTLSYSAGKSSNPHQRPAKKQ